jgi:hypothetical protein
MKANRIWGVGGIVLAAFAMGTLAQASTLDGVPLSTDTSLSMSDVQTGIITESGGFDLTDLSFDACPADDCLETVDEGALTAPGVFEIPRISYAFSPSPEPATFVLVGLTLAVLPLLRKKRS